MERDAERSAVYAAELAAFDGTDLEDVRSFEAITRLAARVTGGGWWQGGSVDVRRARSDARSSSTRCGGDQADVNTIRLAGSQMTVATVAHELAHALAGVRHGHDATFRRAFVDVVAVMTNIDSVERRRELHVDQLTDAFRASGLRLGERGWSAPPPNTTGPIAL